MVDFSWKKFVSVLFYEAARYAIIYEVHVIQDKEIQ